jgi:TRAP-type mannitol/chloroaromatic compound transport system permease small subunit
VRIDLIYDRLEPRTQVLLDNFTFIFFVMYVGALLWIGTSAAWSSMQQSEGTGTPWNPPIWPVKFAIPLAALLLLLQGIANLLRDTGVAKKQSRAT